MRHGIIPIFQAPNPRMLSVEVPEPAVNLFQRIIRNPTAPNRPMRERRCAEMLCAVLQNCPRLRTVIFERLGTRCGFADVRYSELDYEIDTEQPIGSKRDDLRIVGYAPHDETRTPVLLWTIEIKVQAGIHYSPMEGGDDREESEPEAGNVTQLENYDRWLRKQEITRDRKAGLVLSISSLQDKVADLSQQVKLQCPWHCLRWSELGDWIEQALSENALPDAEHLLTRHLLGFILQHLRDPNSMSENSIDIDDVALLRAFAIQGRACEKRIDRLVAPLLKVLDDANIPGSTAAKHQSALFRPSGRSMAWVYLAGRDNQAPSSGISLMTGVDRDLIRMWIEVNPSSNISTEIRAACAKGFDKLLQSKPAWEIPTPEQSTWKVIHRSQPLARLLAVDDQPKALAELVQRSLDDLRDAGIFEAVHAIAVGER